MKPNFKIKPTISYLEFGAWNLELGAFLLEFGIWNLELGI